MKKVIVFSFVLLGSLMSKAQSNLTLYNMKHIPQRSSVNPALTPDCRWYLGTPGLSSIDLNFNSNALQFNQISSPLVPSANPGKYTLDVSQLSNILDNGAFVHLGMSVELLNFGFRVNKSMFSFSATEKIKTRVAIPKDFLKLAFEGNGGANVGYDFNFNFGLDILHTREFALGYSRSLLKDKLTVGGRLKYVQGLNVVNTVKNDVVFTTHDRAYGYTVSADIEVDVSTPFLDSTLTPEQATRALLGNGNSGFGIDLGAQLKLTDKISLSASIVDLGVIKWNNNTSNIKSINAGASFDYNGIDVIDYIGDSVSGGAGFVALGDTLLDVFALDTSNSSFTTGLLGEFYLGANLNITKNHNAGLLVYGSFNNKQFFPAVTLSWNSMFGKLLALSASYSVVRGSYTNVGVGMGLNLGVEQFYFASDNVLGVFTGDVQNMSARFGWNHVIGKKNK
jgi:hypothetical protein|tara:strand:+ start:3957 stop:5309 length:1353 start_codon:yes stop_codon:yes gene_type:complete